MTWDDHETENDYAGLAPRIRPILRTINRTSLARARAYQVYYEHMPLRAERSPSGRTCGYIDVCRLGGLIRSSCWIRASTGRLEHRGLRADRASRWLLPDGLDPARTIRARRSELADRRLRALHRNWNVLANQVPFAPNETNADPAIARSAAKNGTAIRPTARRCSMSSPRGPREHGRHHRRRASELRAERARRLRASWMLSRLRRSSSAPPSAAAATARSRPRSGATPTIRTWL